MNFITIWQKRRTIEILENTQTILFSGTVYISLLFMKYKIQIFDWLQAEVMIAEKKQHVFLSPLIVIQMKLFTRPRPQKCKKVYENILSRWKWPFPVLKKCEPLL